MTRRTKTYIAADWDGDHDAVEALMNWNDSDYYGLSFTNAHDLQQSRDSSLNCSIKKSLKERMDASKCFVLIVGDNTDRVTSGSCRYCRWYSGTTQRCSKGYSVDMRSYIQYECSKAIEADVPIVVLYNSTQVRRQKCPEAVRYAGTHRAMRHWVGGSMKWDYQAVKDAFSF
ncbi:TIR domain-containing protein [Adlercreutzia sp. ZJ141]|uniref:TIR domain-containing protein n=1 Tax=Adlercreutzia sp. ZJ141 TaxID=2709406 RepID=UPI0013ECFFE9|nr:TIR domain-containing protein [Adlercreutzia sp. ZJ141]